MTRHFFMDTKPVSFRGCTDGSGQVIDFILPAQRIHRELRNDSVQHQVFQLRWPLTVLEPIPPGAFFEEPQILFLKDLFHASKQGVTKPLIRYAA